MACRPAPSESPRFVTTINPLRAIVSEIAGGRAEVIALVSPGASPHTYEPRPSDAAHAQSALALLYASDGIDAWAAKLPAKERIEMCSFVPEPMRLPWMDTVHAEGHGDDHGHDHAAFDGHFWSDPLSVKSMLPALVARMSALDPDGAPIYAENAAQFALELDSLDQEMKTMFAELGGRPVLLFHPSWNYFMHRYGLEVAGMIEPDPGKESTVRFIEGIVRIAREEGVRAVFTEPQLPRRPAEVVAEAAGLPLFELDPNGGAEGRRSYRELILYNATQLQSALK